ncbi:reverse transcriptase domain-containing protein, partial [Tanacetum coccineum]
MNNVNANGGNKNGRNGGNRNGGNNGCSYKVFLACNPRDYNGKGGAVALTRWIEKMESVIENSGCAENQKVKYAASSFINKALTWWNTQVQARGHEADLGMTWVEFKALLMEEFYPSNEMEKLESEFWNHTMVGANHARYTNRFHELAKLVPHLVNPKSKRIERYISGLAPQIRVRCGTLTMSSEKRKEVEETSKQGGSWKDNKKEKVGKGFMATTPPRNENVGSYSKCAKCSAYHPEGGPCRLCYNCPKLGHFARDCRHRLDMWLQLALSGWKIIKGFVMNVGASIIFAILVLIDALQDWKRISDKRTKNKAKNDKTEHGMEKCEKDKVKVQKVKGQSSVSPL